MFSFLLFLSVIPSLKYHIWFNEIEQQTDVGFLIADVIIPCSYIRTLFLIFFFHRYPDYEFLSDNEVSKSAGLAKRYTDLSLRGVVTDIQLLSETDFLVCTFSSQVSF